MAETAMNVSCQIIIVAPVNEVGAHQVTGRNAGRDGPAEAPPQDTQAGGDESRLDQRYAPEQKGELGVGRLQDGRIAECVCTQRDDRAARDQQGTQPRRPEDRPKHGESCAGRRDGASVE